MTYQQSDLSMTNNLIFELSYELSFRPAWILQENKISDRISDNTATLTYYYNPAILQNKLTPLSIFRDLALRKGD